MLKFLIGLLPLSLFACAPLIPKGSRVVTSTLSYFETHHFFSTHGQVLKSYNDFQRTQIDILAEYGLSHRNNVSVWVAFDAIRDHLNGNAYEFADAEVRWKQALRRGECSILSAELIALVPLLTE